MSSNALPSEGHSQSASTLKKSSEKSLEPRAPEVGEEMAPEEAVESETKSATTVKDAHSSRSVVTTSKTGITSSKSEITSSKTGITTSNAGITSSKEGITSSKTGITTSKEGITSSKTEITSSKTGITSSKTGIPSSKIDVTLSKATISPSKTTVGSTKQAIDAKLSQQQLETLPPPMPEAGDTSTAVATAVESPSVVKLSAGDSKLNIPPAKTQSAASLQVATSKPGVSPSVTRTPYSQKPSPDTRASVARDPRPSVARDTRPSVARDARPSVARDARPSIMSRHSAHASSLSFKQANEQERAKIVRFMNTYRLESRNVFSPERVEAVMKEVLTRELQEVQYDFNAAPKLAMHLSGEIRAKVKALAFDRYRIVVTVDIGEKQMHSLYSGFRFLWDTERDKYAMYTFENMTLFAIACCFGVYYD